MREAQCYPFRSHCQASLLFAALLLLAGGQARAQELGKRELELAVEAFLQAHPETDETLGNAVTQLLAEVEQRLLAKARTILEKPTLDSDDEGRLFDVLAALPAVAGEATAELMGRHITLKYRFVRPQTAQIHVRIRLYPCLMVLVKMQSRALTRLARIIGSTDDREVWGLACTGVVAIGRAHDVLTAASGDRLFRVRFARDFLRTIREGCPEAIQKRRFDRCIAALERLITEAQPYESNQLIVVE